MVQTTLKKNKIKNGVLKNGIKYILNDNDTELDAILTE